MFGLKQSNQIFACMAIALCMIIALPGCGGRRGEQARQLGDVHLQNRNYTEAQSKYEEALAIDPADAKAQLGLAHVARQRGELAAALKGYEATIALDANEAEAYVQAARIHLSQGAPEKATATAEALEKIEPLGGLLLRASIFRAQGQTEEAIALLEEVREADPTNTSVRIDLGQAYLQRGDAQAAEAELRTALEQDADSLRARLALINILRSEGRLGDMETELQESIAQAESNDAPARARALKLELVQVILGQGRSDEALELAKAMAADSPDQPWVQYVYANCLAATGNQAEAIQAMQRAAIGLPEEPDVAEALVRLQRGEDDSTEPMVAETPATTETPSVAPVAQPAIGLDTTDWRLLWNSASLQQLLLNRDKYDDDDPMLKEVLVLAAMFTGRSDITKELIVTLPQDSPLPKLYARMAERDAEGALAIVNDWQETDTERAVMSTNTRAFVHAMIGLRAKALELFVRTLRSYPENGVALYNIATMYNSAGMPAFAARSLSKLLEQAPNALEVRILHYQTQRNAGLEDEALATAEITYSLFPNERDTIINLGNAYLDNGDLDLALKVFERGMEVLSDDPSLIGTVALAHLRVGDIAKGVELFDSITFEGREAARAAEMSAFCDVLAGDAAAALETLATVEEVALSPGGVFTLASAYLATDKPADAAAALAKGSERLPIIAQRGPAILAALGESTSEPNPEVVSLVDALKDDNAAIADFALAHAAISFQIYRPAVDLLERAEAKIGNHPPIAILLLSALTPPTSYPDRVARAEAVVSRYSGAYVYPGLSGVYAKADDPEGQRKALERGQAKYPEDVTILRAIALEAGASDDLPRAVETYKRILELSEGNGPIFNNYAYFLLRAQGDPKVALEYAQKATETLEGDPKAIHTLGMALLENGLIEDAAKQLGLAAQMRPGDPATLLDLGRALIASDRAEEGRSLIARGIQNADALGIEFDRREEALAIVGEGR